jgi:hypothetical protein
MSDREAEDQEITLPPETDVEAPAQEAEAPAAPDTAAVEAEAARYGWKPRDKWRGDATGWVDAPAYLERSKTLLPVIQAQNAELREQIERDRREFTERTARLERIHEEARKREIEAVKAEMAAAKREMDFDRFEATAARKAELERQTLPPPPAPEVDPTVRDWIAANPVVTADPMMARMLLPLGEEAMRLGFRSPAEQVDYAERRLRSLFPDKWKAPEPQPQRRAFAPVDGGGLAPVKRGRGAADLPAEARQAGERYVREGLFKSLDEYAADYWSM